MHCRYGKPHTDEKPWEIQICEKLNISIVFKLEKRNIINIWENRMR